MKLKITVDSKQYEVEVEVAEAENSGASARSQVVKSSAARTQVAAAPQPSRNAAPVHEEKVCRSPVSGIVASVAAQPGQKIQAGDPLLMLEAMKMETSVTAPVAGTIAAVKVKAGDSVQSGQVLVEFQ